ncbi:MAG: FAD-binding protein [Chitinophagales bacterium]|nr:FAD-binding protein [Chitinophagales bacterium]MCZ2393315.1 FAD-binding protein [Chitinophagales bacterium]
MAKIPNWKWEETNEKSFERKWAQLIERLYVHWEISTQKKVHQIHFPIADVNEKQKKLLRDVFANMTTKRILFQNDLRIKYTFGNNYWQWKSQLAEIKFSDFILIPIHENEILQILFQAKENNISLQCFLKSNMKLVSKSITNRLYGIVSLEDMDKIKHLDKTEKQISVQAGAKVAVVQKYLNDNGYELLFDVRGQEHLSIIELFNNCPSYKSSVIQWRVATPIGLITASQDNGLKDFFLQNSSTSIPYEMTLSIRPIAKSIRQINAWLPDMQSVEKILLAFEQNNISPNKTHFYQYQPSSVLIQEEIIENVETPYDFFNTLFRNPEELIFKDDILRPIAFSLEFIEYQYSISSVLIKAKDIILENQGKISVHQLSQNAISWMESYPYFQDKLIDTELDNFHISEIIPFNKIEDNYREVKKRFEKPLFYKNNKVEYHIQFSEFKYPNIKIDIYFISPRQYRKTEFADEQTYSYIKALLSPIPKMSTSIHDKLISDIKNLIDPNNTII